MKIVHAKLIKRITDDGLMEVQDDVFIGRKYRVDLDSLMVLNLFNVDVKKAHCKELITNVEEGGQLPTELLEIEGRG